MDKWDKISVRNEEGRVVGEKNFRNGDVIFTLPPDRRYTAIIEDGSSCYKKDITFSKLTPIVEVNFFIDCV